MVQKFTPGFAASQKSLSHIARMTEGILVNKPVQKQWSVVEHTISASNEHNSVSRLINSFFIGQHLKIERSALPDDFQDLWPKVIGETGAAPVSYIKVKDANVISMSLPSQIRQSSHILTTAEHKLKFNSNYVPDRASLHDSPVSGSHDVAVNTVPKRVSSGVTRISKCFDYCLSMMKSIIESFF